MKTKKLNIYLRFGIIFMMLNVISMPTFSQSVFYGLKGGLNYSSFYGKNAATLQEPRLAVNAGGFFTFPLNDQWNMQIELDYSQKGTYFKEPIANVTQGWLKVKEHLNYLTLPILLKFYLGNRIRAFFNIGAEAGYMINSKRTANAFAGNLTYDPYIYYPYKLKNTNIEFLAGTGIKYKKYFLECRFNLGITNIYSENIRESRNLCSSLTFGIILNDKRSRQRTISH